MRESKHPVPQDNGSVASEMCNDLYQTVDTLKHITSIQTRAAIYILASPLESCNAVS